MLGFIDTLQDQSIGILTGQGIVAGGIGALSRRTQDSDAHGNKLGVELVHISTAVQMQGKMVQPWRRAVILPLLPNAPGTFEGDRKDALFPIGKRPTRHGCRARLHGDSTVAEQRQNGIIEGNGAVRIRNGAVEMAQGSTDHEVLRLLEAVSSSA
jgi:hypothetical protein